MSYIKEVLLSNLFDISLTEKDILAYMYAIGFEDHSIVSAYAMSVKREMPLLANTLFKQEVVRAKFIFMEELLGDFIDNKRVLSLAVLPAPLVDKSFDEILEVIFGEREFEPYRKRVGVALKKFGTHVLSNIYILSLLIDIHKLIDNVLALDHSQAIDESLISKLNQQGDKFCWLVENYKTPRIFKLLLTYEDESFNDLLNMINTIKSIDRNGYVKVIKNNIGKKPISFDDIHAKLLPTFYEITNSALMNTLLYQDVEYLDGATLYEYTISVPRTGSDLFMTGKILKHCIASYVENVVGKSCQIINLKYNQNLAYTIELLPSSFGYQIGQFKGCQNSNIYEGLEGEKYRRSLIQKLNGESQILLNLHY